MDKVLFGARVRVARHRARLTSDELAELCECTPVSIRQIESGVRLPSLPKMVFLCNALKVTPNELLGPELTFPIDEGPPSECDDRLAVIVQRIRGLTKEKREFLCVVIEFMLDNIGILK